MPALQGADAQPRAYEVAIVGNDALLAALPARPLQLAHAILACGFDLVVPVSWGEEALAEHALREVAQRPDGPAIFCACPSVRERLLLSGPELAPFLVSCVAPPVATARYLRSLDAASPLRITFIGACDGARDAVIDARVLPADFLRHLAARGISLVRQPAIFDSVVPPDRRRHFSLPGGSPTPEALAVRDPRRQLVTLGHGHLATELADVLLTGERVLLDLAPRLACSCCGGPSRTGSGPRRDDILALEPPRSAFPVIDHGVKVVLSAPATLTAPSAPTAPAGAPPRTSPARPSEPSAAQARIEGVHSIESARRRAERRYIAVTPPGTVSARRTPVKPLVEPGRPTPRAVRTGPSSATSVSPVPPPTPAGGACACRAGRCGTAQSRRCGGALSR